MLISYASFSCARVGSASEQVRPSSRLKWVMTLSLMTAENLHVPGNKAGDELHVAPQADSHCLGQSVSTAANQLHG